jgi:hypothetical protein
MDLDKYLPVCPLYIQDRLKKTLAINIINLRAYTNFRHFIDSSARENPTAHAHKPGGAPTRVPRLFSRAVFPYWP